MSIRCPVMWSECDTYWNTSSGSSPIVIRTFTSLIADHLWEKVLCSTEHLIRFNLLCCSFLKRLHVVQHFTHRVCANHTVRQTISSREDLLSLTMNPDRWLNTPKKTKILKRNSCQVVFAATARNNGFPFHIINGKPHASDCPTCLFNTNFSWA